MKNYSAETLNSAAKTGKIIPIITRDSLEKAYNFYRDNAKLLPNSYSEEKLVLTVCSADYGDFINNTEFKDWFVYNKHIKSYRLGLVGTMVGILVFSDIFLEQPQRILKQNTMFLMPKPDTE